jgi:hypothetical protein
MDTLKEIEKLAQLAQAQAIPDCDISNQILAQIRLAPKNSTSFAVFDFLAGCFATAASILLYIGINAWNQIVSPLTQFFAPLQECRLW